MASRQPVSRDLARIIRESSRGGQEAASLNEHLQALQDRQCKAVEFYLRACAQRLASP
jgi:hypothetical protein